MRFFGAWQIVCNTALDKPNGMEHVEYSKLENNADIWGVFVVLWGTCGVGFGE